MHPSGARRAGIVAAAIVTVAFAFAPAAAAGDGVRVAALPAASIEVDPFIGWFAVEGTSPGGRAYRGTVSITRKRASYRVIWTIDAKRYRGLGQVRSGRLLVNWGTKKPVIYVPGPGGRLEGTWDGGLGREELTPTRRSDPAS
jgi:hypothetical protein